jgi:hypothetical protein
LLAKILQKRKARAPGDRLRFFGPSISENRIDCYSSIKYRIGFI